MIKKIKAFMNKVIEEYMVESLCKNVKNLVESKCGSHLIYDYYKSTNFVHIDFENKIRHDGNVLTIRKSISILDHDIMFLNDIEILQVVEKLTNEKGGMKDGGNT